MLVALMGYYLYSFVFIVFVDFGVGKFGVFFLDESNRKKLISKGIETRNKGISERIKTNRSEIVVIIFGVSPKRCTNGLTDSHISINILSMKLSFSSLIFRMCAIYIQHV